VATQDGEAVAIENAAWLIIAFTEQRNWLEVFWKVI
jgi:hypothetical protein